uniref:Transposase n=1 Tax=Bursaphelenchus xylophilus TaxID=6326 RepID=A0A1I7SJ51_BURXY
PAAPVPSPNAPIQPVPKAEAKQKKVLKDLEEMLWIQKVFCELRYVRKKGFGLAGTRDCHGSGAGCWLRL